MRGTFAKLTCFKIGIDESSDGNAKVIRTRSINYLCAHRYTSTYLDVPNPTTLD